MLVFLFASTPLPRYAIFMLAFCIGLVVNFPNVKDQNKKIKEYGSQAVSLTVTLFAVPMLMILGTNAFYYAMLPIAIGVVEPYGVPAEMVAMTFLLTATLGTPLSPSVATNYVGLGLTDLSIGEHIKYSLRICWPASVVGLILCTLTGVIQF